MNPLIPASALLICIVAKILHDQYAKSFGKTWAKLHPDSAKRYDAKGLVVLPPGYGFVNFLFTLGMYASLIVLIVSFFIQAQTNKPNDTKPGNRPSNQVDHIPGGIWANALPRRHDARQNDTEG